MAKIQMDNFVRILEDRGIYVDRPTPLSFDQEVATPDWKHGSMVGCMPARDVLLTVGNEILEATMSHRSRWFEYLAYRPLLQGYFEKDAHMRWEAAPKPRLTDSSFKTDYLNDSISMEERLKMVAEKSFVTTEVEPLFDAADVIRFGKDLFVQHGFTTNIKGMDWLQRHFPNHRIHALNFPGDPYPIHIDATFAPLRPGLILNNPVRRLPAGQRRVFEMNGWEIVEAAQPAHDTPPPLCYSSVWLSMNVLVLDPNTVCVEASEEPTIRQIEGFGMEVIPVPFRDAYALGGGLHCATADVYREGPCEDYFPKQTEGS
jgi:glycine amidinotransferase